MVEAQPRRRGRLRRRAAGRPGLLSPLLDDALGAYQPLHAARAELLRRAGDRPAAAARYERAIELSANAVERSELQRRLAEL